MRQKVLPVYFFPGPETGRKKNRIDAINSAMKQADGQEPEFHRFYPFDSAPDQIVSILRNGSLFSSRRLIQVADAHTLKKPDLQIFKDYINTPSPEAVLIFTTDETPGSRDYPRELAKALPKAAVEVFWEMFERDKRGWVMRFFREKGLRIAPEAVDLLLDMTEGTTEALTEACGHLAFASGADKGKIINEEDADSVLEHSRAETVYTLFDRFCKRDLTGVLDAWRKIVHSDPMMADRAPALLLNPLINLRDFKVLVSRGLPREQAAQELKLRGGKRALRSYNNGVSAFSQEELNRALDKLIDLTAWLRSAPRESGHLKFEFWMCRALAG